MLSTQPYKGVRDFFPEDLAIRNYIFNIWRTTCVSFGFEEYDGPFIEPFELFASKSGEELVNEQLYSFTDRGERKVAIRPEMTPTVSRMAAERIRGQSPLPLKWFSIANFYRYEKPQKGRGREFFQLNADILGEDSVLADLEILLLNNAIMKAFGAKPSTYQIRVNNRFLSNYLFTDYLQITPEISQRVAKIIDKKAKVSEEAFGKMLDEAGLSKEQVEGIKKILYFTLSDLKKIPSLPEKARMLTELLDRCADHNLTNVVYDPTIMRGLDYYDGNVFEQFDLTEGNNRSMFGGGRYDGLISLFIDKKVPAVGFAPGDITLLEFLKSWNLLPKNLTQEKVLVTVFPGNEACLKASYDLAQELRKNVNVEVYLNNNTELSKQLKYADKKGIPFAVILGPDELKTMKVTLKNLKDQSQVSLATATEIAKEVHDRQNS